MYTLAVCNADGSNPHPVSFHETQEWDPTVLNDGRMIYTRWDYVDRNAVHYQQLWSVRPDGSDVRIYYGNNTLNPVGVWEARPIPGSSRIMATAAAHHAMTAGSIILLDVTHGIDGPAPITRLTPDALFPESEAPVANGAGGAWAAPYGVVAPLRVPPDAIRWPGHCYKSPQPLSETVFLAALQLRPPDRRAERQPGEHVRAVPRRCVREQGAALPRPERVQPLADAAETAPPCRR